MRVAAVSVRKVLNSRARPTNEFEVRLEGGARGWGSAPEGETPSRYERPSRVSEQVLAEFLSGTPFADAGSQRELDEILRAHRSVIGHGCSLAISVAYLEATARAADTAPHFVLRRLAELEGPARPRVPKLLINVLNGGLHARTNPVASDFTEYLIVPSVDSIDIQLDAYHAVDAAVRRRLATLPVEWMSGSRVHLAPRRENGVWIEFLCEALEETGLDRDFGIMIDASAGDLRRDGRYQLARTDGSAYTPGDFVDYWSTLVAQYGLAMIEDPFAEEDHESWRALRRVAPGAALVGDNLCSTDAERIAAVGDGGMISAVLIKPNQAGTVTETVDAIVAARRHGLEPVPSHRSIETDAAWLADVCIAFEVEYAKLGLLSDFATIQKLNRILRHRAETAVEDLR